MKEVIMRVASFSADYPKAPIYVADLVRCKECKHWCKGDDVYGICYRCPNTRQMRCDDFCSYGVRKTNTTAEEKPTPIRDYMVHGKREGE